MLGTKPLEDAVAGATKIVEAQLVQADGTQAKVVAEGAVAEALTAGK